MQNNTFDFFVGRWTSTQRRLREILAGSDDWYEFPGHTTCWSALGGAANLDEVTFPTQGFSGLTVRLYSPQTDEWSLYWVNSGNGTLALPPQVGRFGDDGVGLFLADDVFQGRPVKVRYIWSGITPGACHWEQGFSEDGGATWETNWTADFSRVA
jgi:hypothetical protein